MPYNFTELERELIAEGSKGADGKNPAGYTKIYALHDGAAIVVNDNRECIDKANTTTQISVKAPAGDETAHNQQSIDPGPHPDPVSYFQGDAGNNQWPIDIGSGLEVGVVEEIVITGTVMNLIAGS